MDTLTREARSRHMARISGRDTKPELAVRRLVHSMGYRYRLHRRDLPGTPDLVFPSRSKVILVHGCYWHRHECRQGRSVPSTRTKFWVDKFAANLSRDRRVQRELHQAGWRVLVVWECQTRTPDLPVLAALISEFLEDGG